MFHSIGITESKWECNLLLIMVVQSPAAHKKSSGICEFNNVLKAYTVSENFVHTFVDAFGYHSVHFGTRKVFVSFVSLLQCNEAAIMFKLPTTETF